MGIPIVDGKVQETANNTQKKTGGNSSLDKDAFLQLLVAQMKYQDPLEPTSNTDYIAQYATFSQVEQMQNMSQTMELTRASSMVGKLVTVSTTTSGGEVKEVQGIVEYVTFENNKAYISIDGNMYPAEDVIAVVDENYQLAIDLAMSFIKAIKGLPTLEELSVGDKETIDTLQKGFNAMTAYQQSFIANELIDKLQQYVEKMKELVDLAGGEEGEGGEGEEGGEGDNTGGTDKV